MRTCTIPASVVNEDIYSLQEVPAQGTIGGRVVVNIGRVDVNGIFVVPQQFEIYEISGENYTELNGPPPTWAPDKPEGTYRNEDLWHYIDLLRAPTATPAPTPTPAP